MDLVMFDWLVDELKKEKIKLPDNQFVRKVFYELLFVQIAHSAGDLFDKSEHELERIMMADRLLTFRLEKKIKSLKY
jgi:hypothetical protein